MSEWTNEWINKRKISEQWQGPILANVTSSSKLVCDQSYGKYTKKKKNVWLFNLALEALTKQWMEGRIIAEL